ncbi:hypothetical protein EDB80DRAFT_683874 [Ilyonectria destructans]|nr:hypothetical protein EDB80DRAFT_683874 [Ilyonectria destructans]
MPRRRITCTLLVTPMGPTPILRPAPRRASTFLAPKAGSVRKRGLVVEEIRSINATLSDGGRQLKKRLWWRGVKPPDALSTGSSSQGSVEVVHGGTRDRLTPNEASVKGTASDSSTSTATSASPDPREELNAIFEKHRGLIGKRGNIPMKTLDSTPIDPVLSRSGENRGQLDETRPALLGKSTELVRIRRGGRRLQPRKQIATQKPTKPTNGPDFLPGAFVFRVQPGAELFSK